MRQLRSVLVATAALGVAAGCGDFGDTDHLKLSGTLEMTEYSLSAPVPGRLTKLLVDEGSPVRKGQVVAWLERYEQTQRDYERTRELYREGGTHKQALEQAELSVSDQRIVSPVDGVVLVKVREAGEALSAGSAVVVVGDNKNWWVRVFVPEGEINRVQVGERATLQLDGLRDPLQGHVSYVSPRAEFTPRNVQTPEERVTQTFSVKVAIDEPPAFLKAGVAADVTLELKRPAR